MPDQKLIIHFHATVAAAVCVVVVAAVVVVVGMSTGAIRYWILQTLQAEVKRSCATGAVTTFAWESSFVSIDLQGTSGARPCSCAHGRILELHLRYHEYFICKNGCEEKLDAGHCF